LNGTGKCFEDGACVTDRIEVEVRRVGICRNVGVSKTVSIAGVDRTRVMVMVLGMSGGGRKDEDKLNKTGKYGLLQLSTAPKYCCKARQLLRLRWE
jgi:hypothetical protein